MLLDFCGIFINIDCGTYLKVINDLSQLKQPDLVYILLGNIYGWLLLQLAQQQ
jgi:hypothetical protein